MGDVLSRLIGYSDEHEMFRDSLRAFLASELTPNVEKWNLQHYPDTDFWKKAGSLGFLGAAIPEVYGGHGADFLYHVIVAQELGKCDGAESCGMLLQSDLPAFHILNYGTEELKKAILPRVIRGETILTVAMTEPGGGSDVGAIRSTAVRDGDHYIINGSKTYISGVHTGHIALTALKTDSSLGSRGISLILVDLDALGVRRGHPLKKMGAQAADAGELFFEDLRVPISRRLGQEGQGLSILLSEVARERLLMAVRSLEEAQRAFGLTVDFVKGRTAFGKKVFEFQNTQFTLATLKTDLAAGRALVDECLAEMSCGGLDPTRAAMAKLWVTEMQGRVVDQCVQLHGGAGYMDEYAISRLYTAARVTRIYGGTSEIMRMVIARTI
jgi:acyl-CoA dehydrogenase